MKLGGFLGFVLLCVVAIVGLSENRRIQLQEVFDLHCEGEIYEENYRKSAPSEIFRGKDEFELRVDRQAALLIFDTNTSPWELNASSPMSFRHYHASDGFEMEVEVSRWDLDYRQETITERGVFRRFAECTPYKIQPSDRLKGSSSSTGDTGIN